MNDHEVDVYKTIVEVLGFNTDILKFPESYDIPLNIGKDGVEWFWDTRNDASFFNDNGAYFLQNSLWAIRVEEYHSEITEDTALTDILVWPECTPDILFEVLAPWSPRWSDDFYGQTGVRAIVLDEMDVVTMMLCLYTLTLIVLLVGV